MAGYLGSSAQVEARSKSFRSTFVCGAGCARSVERGCIASGFVAVLLSLAVLGFG